MKPNIIHSIAVCLAAFALPFMVACSNQEESLPEVESNIQAVFTLDLGDAANRKTRATPTDGEYNTGSGLENFIDLTKKNFRCYLFGLDNTPVSALEVASIYNFGESKYSIRLRLKDTEEIRSALTTGCRFVFLANWGSYIDPTPEMTIEELCSSSFAKFEFSQQKTQLSETNLIPMYGVKEFENGVQDFKDGKEVSDIGTLYLLRAYAKVDVNILFKDFEDVPVVTSVSLTHSSSKGYKAPANVTKQSDYITGSWLTDYTPVNIPNDATDIDLTLTKDENTRHYVAYVPEYRNVNDSKEPVGNPSRIKICFTIGDTEAGGREVEGYVDFRYSDTPPTGVSSGQYFDIARNNWYKFDVTVKGKDIDWIVDVIPFTSVELKPDLGLEREEFTGYIIGKDGQGRDCWYDGNYYDPETAVPLYLGPKDKPGESVTINDKEYLLVYADYGLLSDGTYISGYERTAANLHHIYDKETRRKYPLSPEGRTGYEGVMDTPNPWLAYYLNDLKQQVWLDETNLRLNCCRTINEWDRLEYSIVAYNWSGYDHDSYNPRFWFDILGNRYPWKEGDTEQKRKDILGEWVKYLE
ncbi:hypothetical protein SAMN05444349_12151 [Bacteroides faecichinchillae]|uniref:Major fimbrial subunit protein N-terminal domain-containing protein n=2 Tax=Bacteroides faecichinchillae TaxID=871325 RepID=A0A1M5C0C2_9BACE|nr:hypothetical protein [Bacteroides faecichinchillae]THG65659.1 hypothetical protein E5981_11545 [Bacteroides faecichinchillae]SHF47892.1 hypothetical protein SAMN05444349_12151 [Bacteroides faecichinchillae]